MGIEHNKDLHIELLRDELIMTREELNKRFRTHDAFKSIVNEVHSTVVLEELKSKTKSIMEDSLRLREYALIVWDADDQCFVVSETKGMTKAACKQAVETLDALVEPPSSRMLRKNEHVYLPLSNGQTVYGALCVTDRAYRENGETWRGSAGPHCQPVDQGARQRRPLRDRSATVRHRRQNHGL